MDNTEIIKQGADISQAALADIAAAAVENAGRIVVTDQETERQALEMQGLVRKEVKRLDAERKDKKSFWQAQADRVDEAYMPLVKRLKDADAKIGSSVSAYRDETRRLLELAESQKRAAVALAQEVAPEERPVAREIVIEARKEAKDAASAAPSTVATKAGRASFTTHYEIEIVDPDLVPRQYCSPDPVKIRAAAVAAKGELEIPGVAVRRTSRSAFRG